MGITSDQKLQDIMIIISYMKDKDITGKGLNYKSELRKIDLKLNLIQNHSRTRFCETLVISHVEACTASKLD
jgi:hypothetical protein